MIARWEQGRATVDSLLAARRLERIPPNRDLADEYLRQARAHLATSLLAAGTDPVGEFQLAYDAARKALASILINQGIRPTSAGGHVAVFEAVLAQLDPPLGDVFKSFRWMRPLCNDSEYPSPDRPLATGDDAVAGRGSQANDRTTREGARPHACVRAVVDAVRSSQVDIRAISSRMLAPCQAATNSANRSASRSADGHSALRCGRTSVLPCMSCRPWRSIGPSISSSSSRLIRT